jgi:hypothetical protein
LTRLGGGREEGARWGWTNLMPRATELHGAHPIPAPFQVPVHRWGVALGAPHPLKNRARLPCARPQRRRNMPELDLKCAWWFNVMPSQVVEEASRPESASAYGVDAAPLPTPGYRVGDV